ncbi:Response regulator with putative antiterminator output domain [Nitrosococcus oceani ATCC 19707]|uniref:Chemotaxis protein CheY n=2 Tax=Nitrosococcus oceani TaxID=1229 RepID=A0A0E2Z7M4_9GAMM|nr:response regulator [Nitrosococcus oceani]ABA57980.1 Response regulator with putative antiterminator output domain [Nitrosococcus oceani ATCC 19707]KFI19580.1 chemotaxis protein CheY [Nitrosococcus oceani C-27]GEM19627.1 two-component system response regulator [Nitrosococcus oceani]
MSPCKILLVDDERFVLSMLAQGLRNVGYEVFEAVSGQAAMLFAEEVKPTIAVVDIRMPEMSGIEVGHWFRRQGIPFIFLSAYDDNETVKMAAKAGALGYLVKPIGVPQLLPTIHAARERADEIGRLKETESQLNAALRGSREISIAVGLLMERYHLTEKDAFERLRTHARVQRCKLHDLARNIIGASEQLNCFK